MPKGIPLTENVLTEKRLVIAHAAAELFFKNGFNETSISQIAQKAGIGKSTIYDYFESKDEIILLLLDEPLAEVRDRAAVIADNQDSIINRIGKILGMHLDVLMRDKAFIFKLSFEFQRLPIAVQARHEVKRQAYQDLLLHLIEEGIGNGEFRDVDPDMVMKILLSILSSILLTARQTGTPQEMLQKAIDVILNGILEEPVITKG
jgi:AcrR family transcriptional regulator